MMMGQLTRSTSSSFASAGRSGATTAVAFDYARKTNTTVVDSLIAYRLGKRLVDIVGALIGLLLLAPIYLCIYIIVLLDSKGGGIHRRRVLAQQEYNGNTLRTFDAYKFRTMIPDADAYLEKSPEMMREYRESFKLVNDPRITRVGAPLRRFSLDELPQLWNVLCGQMSLVGPRMITPAELALYGEDADRLLSVTPGLTGLWQVSGRTDLSYAERVRLDMYYIEQRSLRLDFEILFRTVGCVLGGRGAV